MTAPAPSIGCISKTLVQAFALMVANPDRWFTAAEITLATGTTKATIYRRFGNLVAADALQAKRVKDFRHYRLHPAWQHSALGLELHRRASPKGVSGIKPV